MPKPVIVYVTPKPPYPLTSGMAIRQFHLLRAYGDLGRIHLATFYSDEAQRSAARSLDAHCERVHFVSDRTMLGDSCKAGPRLLTASRRLRGYRPTAVTWSYSPEMARLLKELSSDADIVHVGRLHMVSHVEGLLAQRRRPGMVLDLDDVEASYRFRQLRHGPREPFLHRAYGYYDVARMWAYQVRAVRWFDRVFVCSERDRRRFPRANVVVVPNGAHVPASLPAHQPDGPTIIFCGLLSYSPNIDAVHFLVEEIFPRIQRAIPDARLMIVGRAPTPGIRALHNGKTVVVASDVASVTDYYGRAAIAAVPLRFGGGTRIKILEAWAYGVPVVSTTIGCEGLDGTDGRHLMVADTPSDFAARCVTLLRSPGSRDRLAMEGRRLVSERYRWEDIGRRAVSDVAALLQSRCGAGGAIIGQDSATPASVSPSGI
jgi:polysaccharide biosynthesis protein PslH